MRKEGSESQMDHRDSVQDTDPVWTTDSLNEACAGDKPQGFKPAKQGLHQLIYCPSPVTGSEGGPEVMVSFLCNWRLESQVINSNTGLGVVVEDSSFLSHCLQVRVSSTL